MDVIEVMETCWAMRYLKPDPVPEELIRQVVYAATRASSPGNSQGWDFVVVTDPATKRRIGDVLAERMLPRLGSTTSDDPVQRRMLAGVAHLVRHFAEVPVERQLELPASCLSRECHPVGSRCLTRRLTR